MRIRNLQMIVIGVVLALGLPRVATAAAGGRGSDRIKCPTCSGASRTRGKLVKLPGGTSLRGSNGKSIGTLGSSGRTVKARIQTASGIIRRGGNAYVVSPGQFRKGGAALIKLTPSLRRQLGRGLSAGRARAEISPAKVRKLEQQHRLIAGKIRPVKLGGMLHGQKSPEHPKGLYPANNFGKRPNGTVYGVRMVPDGRRRVGTVDAVLQKSDRVLRLRGEVKRFGGVRFDKVLVNAYSRHPQSVWIAHREFSPSRRGRGR